MEKYESVNHPSHYNSYSVEVIEMFEKIYGIDSTIMFCEMNALKYRMRLGLKPENSIEQDLAKEKWYLDKAKELNIKNNPSLQSIQLQELISKIERILPIKKCSERKYDILYVDCNQERNIEQPFYVFTKTGFVNMDLSLNDYDDIYKQFKSHIDKMFINSNKETFKIKNDTKNLIDFIQKLSNNIFDNGKIGKPNVILINENNYNMLKSFNNNFIKINCDFIIDNDLENKIYLYSKNSIDQVGLIFAYDDVSMKYDFILLGFKPENNYEIIEFI